MTMKRVTLEQLLKILDAHRGAVIVAMVTRTEPRLLVRSRKTREPSAERYPHGIEKLCHGRFLLANNYGANVRAQRRRESHPNPKGFRAGQIWCGKGERVGRFLVRHTDSGAIYVRARPASDQRGLPVRLWERWINLATGADAAGDELVELQRDWLADRPAENRKQQLARTIPYRTYQVLSIHSATVGAETYRLMPDASAFSCPS